MVVCHKLILPELAWCGEIKELIQEQKPEQEEWKQEQEWALPTGAWAGAGTELQQVRKKTLSLKNRHKKAYKNTQMKK